MAEAPETLPRPVLERKLRSSRMLNLLLGVVAAAAIAFAAIHWVQSESPSANSKSSSVTTDGQQDGASGKSSGKSSGSSTGLERRDPADTMAIGKIDAPIVLSEWVDLRCPFCAVFSRDTLPKIVKEYVDSGKVRIEFYDVAFFGEESTRAAVAARAAGEQGKYSEFLSAVYDVAPENGHPDLPKEELVALAEKAGVKDLERFAADMERQDLIEAVSKSTERAQQVGVTGVPFFVAGSKAVSGAQPIDAFRQFLDQALSEAA